MKNLKYGTQLEKPPDTGQESSKMDPGCFPADYSSRPLMFVHQRVTQINTHASKLIAKVLIQFFKPYIDEFIFCSKHCNQLH